MDIALILSILLLLAAPLLARFVGAHPQLRALLDGFVIMTVLALISLTLLPDALIHAGLWGLALGLAGFTLPWIAEFLFHRSEEMTHRIVLLVACFALIIHAASDGALLAYTNTLDHGGFIATGILLHRLGTAIAVWWLLRPVLSAAGGYAVLAGLGVMTLVGYFLANLAGDWYGLPLVGYWQAFASGSLLHVVLHPLEHGNGHDKTDTLTSQRIGTFLGLVFTAVLALVQVFQPSDPTATNLHSHGAHNIIHILQNTGASLSPFFIVILFVMGLIATKRAGTLGAGLTAAGRGVLYCSIFWLLASLISVMAAPDIAEQNHAGHSDTLGQIWLVLWLVLASIVITVRGARAFIAPMLPLALSHGHNHTHTHSHD